MAGGILGRLRTFGEVAQMAADLALGRYPRFVYGGALGDGELPVFTLHGAEPAPFEAMLQFLSANRYATLSADQLERFMRGERSGLPERAVALTFDDGMGSVFGVAWPLLEKYGMQATVFLVPGKIRDDGAARPHLGDAWAGRAPLGAVTARDASDMPFLTWNEIERMHRSGTLGFESHTLNHALIFTAPEPIDFVHPAALARYHFFEFAFAHLFEGDQGGHRLPPLGTPIYASASRLSAELRFVDDPGLREACIEFTARSGGETFFAAPAWRRELSRFAQAYRRTHPSGGRMETEEEQRAGMQRELAGSKRAIEERLGCEVRHLCYPWAVGSPLAVELSRATGYRSNHWGRIAGRLINRVGEDPFYVSRMGADLLRCLPGSGRESLAAVLRRKAWRRARTGSAYLSH